MKTLLIKNIVMDGRRRDILIEGNRIGALAPVIRRQADRVLDGRGCTALPSLLNAHTHSAMALLRGYADDMALKEWLETKIWPIEARLTEDDVYAGALLACLEMIKSGTTFCNDMYWHWHGTARAVEAMGIRAVIGADCMDLGNPDTCREQKAFNEKLFAERSRYSDRILFALGPHAIYTVSGEGLKWINSFAERHGVFAHIHLSETRREVDDCLKTHGMRPVEYLESIGFLGPEVIAAHGVHLSEKEMEILARRRVAVVHMPVSNMKLAVGGILPYAALKRAGVTVLLGTDGCSSNNCLDMFQTMKVAALGQKHNADDPTCLPAADAWAMATRQAADAFRLPCGVLEKGRLADLILVDLNRPECAPGHNTISDLVYAANGYCVDTTICDGRVLMHRRKVADEDEILREARRRIKRVLARA